MHNYDEAKKILASLSGSKDLTYMVNQATMAFGNPITIVDLNFKSLAQSDDVSSADPVWNDILSLGEHSERSLKIYKDEGFFDICANAKTAAVLSSPLLEHDRIYGKIFGKRGMLIAGIGMLCCNPVDEQLLELFEVFRQAIERKFQRDAKLKNLGEVFQEQLIKLLIEGIGDRVFYSNQVAAIYEGLCEDLLLLLITPLEKTDIRSLKKTIEKEHPRSKCFVYGDEIIAICSALDSSTRAARRKRAVEQLERENAIMGVSAPFQNLFNLSRHYSEAKTALETLSANAKDGERIFLYADCPQNTESSIIS